MDPPSASLRTGPIHSPLVVFHIECAVLCQSCQLSVPLEPPPRHVLLHSHSRETRAHTAHSGSPRQRRKQAHVRYLASRRLMDSVVFGTCAEALAR
jgi:hypothetical protein